VSTTAELERTNLSIPNETPDTVIRDYDRI